MRQVAGGEEHADSGLADVAGAFRERFGEQPSAVVRAPGRVNIIGEHTDYNDGFVLPMAIDREVRIALRPRDDGRVRIVALDLGDETEFDLATLQRAKGWAEYPKGVAWALRESGLDLSGFEATMSGNVPRGSGLSSSAALELATARAFHVVSGFAWDAREMALACQRAENDWLGVNSGIMDQLASAAGVEGHALLIDCRSLEASAVPLPPGTALLVLDTGTRRGLVTSAYNERRAQCEAAAAYLGASALRDVTVDRFLAQASGMSENLRKRARHVVTENERTVEAAAAMRAGDAGKLGGLMDRSHESLRDDFEVSSAALDAIVTCARQQPGCYGARLTGAGFGGCAVALVEASSAAAIAAAVRECYTSSTGNDAAVYSCRPSAGAGEA